MKDKSPDTGPAVWFPPPLVFIGFVFLGLALDYLVGLPPIPMGPALGWAGTGCSATGFFGVSDKRFWSTKLRHL